MAATVSVVLGLLAIQEAGLQAAENAFEDGQYSIAKIELEHYLADHPNDSRAQVLYARSLVALNEHPERALQIFETHQASSPEETQDWARAYFLTRQWSAGIPLMELVVQAQPKNATAWHELIAARLRIRQYDKALREAEKYAELPGHEARGHLFMGTILHEEYDSEKAISHLNKVLEFDPTAENLPVPPGQFFAFFAQVLLMSGEPEEARKMAERSISHERTAKAFVFLGEAFQQLGDEANARLAWREALREDINNSEARTRLALLELTENNPQDALTWLKRVSEQPDVDAEAAYTLERIYRALGDEENTQKWADEAARLREHDSLISQLQAILLEHPNSPVGLQYQAWRFASRENWAQAKAILSLVSGATLKSDFHQRLATAVAEKDAAKIPPLDEFYLPNR